MRGASVGYGMSLKYESLLGRYCYQRLKLLNVLRRSYFEMKQWRGGSEGSPEDLVSDDSEEFARDGGSCDIRSPERRIFVTEVAGPKESGRLVSLNGSEYEMLLRKSSR